MSSGTTDRIAVISSRGISYVRSRSLLYSFEDFAADMGIATVVTPPTPYFNRVHSGIVRHVHAHAPAIASHLVNTARTSAVANDIRLITCQSLTELPLLLPYFEKAHAGQLIACLMEEVWASDIPKTPMAVQLLKQCDVIFVGCHGGVAPLAAATGKPTIQLSPSIDTLACNPYAQVSKSRAIELYYMGRRQPDLHEGLLAWSTDGGQFYLYDTAGNAVMSDHRDHRRHFIDLIQRSRFFVVAPGKSSGDNRLTTPQDEVGTRYYEGAACGAILLGTPNRSSVLQQHFGYEQAVIGFDGGARQLIDLITTLGRDEQQLDGIRRRGVANALRSHDFAYRWKIVLQALGLPESERLARRIAQLNEVADSLLPSAQPSTVGAQHLTFS